MYYKFAVPENGFPKKVLREMQKWMKTWPRFYAAFHDEVEAVVPLNDWVRKPKRTRYWLEVSDKPLPKRVSWKTEEMQKFLKPYRP